MAVKDGLAGDLAAVRADVKTFHTWVVSNDPSSHALEQQEGIGSLLFSQPEEVGHMAPWNDQRVSGCNRKRVVEGDAGCRFLDDSRARKRAKRTSFVTR